MQYKTDTLLYMTSIEFKTLFDDFIQSVEDQLYSMNIIIVWAVTVSFNYIESTDIVIFYAYIMHEIGLTKTVCNTSFHNILNPQV